MESTSKVEISEAFIKLGDWMRSTHSELIQTIQNASNFNPWFTPIMVQKSFFEIGSWFEKENLTKWAAAYSFSTQPKVIGLILAGNIPLVGFHDIVCILMSGNIAQVKLSSDDALLTKTVLKKLIALEPTLQTRIQIVEKLQHFDAVIATGSNNTSRYFDYYFGKYPHIIRKNRHSIAVVNGKESADDLAQLGHDIFDYFGLGCRNVSKIFVPQHYDLTFLLQSLESFQEVSNHHKYVNNYNYNKSIYLINNVKHLDNGFLLLTENQALSSPLSVLYYEYYESIKKLESLIKLQYNDIQCVVSAIDLNLPNPCVDFGQSQCPNLNDYADQIDVMKFLERL